MNKKITNYIYNYYNYMMFKTKNNEKRKSTP